MTPDIRSFPTVAVLSLATGKLLCDFATMHTLAEFLVGGPVWTHQFAHRAFVDEMQQAIYGQHPALRAFDASGVTTENWKGFAAEATRRFGKSLELYPMGEPEHAAAAFVEPLAGKQVIAVEK